MKKVTKNEELLMFRKELRHKPDLVEQVQVKAPATADGYVRFYKLEHGWTCGACSERVTIAKFSHHVWHRHGAR